MSHVPSPGEDARSRLLRSGLRLFAQQGYSKTSTRELAEDAGVNVASISYYFGDKAGLYRAVFFEPLGAPQGGGRGDWLGLSLPQALADQLKEGGRIAAVFMDGALGTVKTGIRMGGRIDWRFAFNASAPLQPGFARARGFML